MVELQEIVQMLNVHKNVVGAASGGPPCASAKTLQRYNSDADGDCNREAEIKRERADAWRQAQAPVSNGLHELASGGSHHPSIVPAC